MFLKRNLLMAVHEKRAIVNKKMDHMEILDASAQQGLRGETGPKGVQ